MEGHENQRSKKVWVEVLESNELKRLVKNVLRDNGFLY